MPNQSDPRYVQSEHAICDALARLLEHKALSSITMSELAREAGVSRGTLYAHFNNVCEAYERAVMLFYKRTQTLDEHFSCATCRESRTTRAYCECLRDAGSYASVVADERFLPTTMHVYDPKGLHMLKEKLQAAGMPEQLAHAICLFQMSGCYSVATSTAASDEEWRQCQEALDRFIQGGLSALGVEL